MNKVVIETNRLVLMEYEQGDATILYEILSNPVTMSFWPAPFTKEQADKWVETNITRYKENGFGRWSVILKENSQVIGDCGIIVSEIDGNLENDLGYIIHHPHWRKGFAYEAADACKNYALKQRGLGRLCANMPFDHGASRKVAEKLGMKKEKEFFNTRNRNTLTFLYSISK